MTIIGHTAHYYDYMSASSSLFLNFKSQIESSLPLSLSSLQVLYIWNRYLASCWNFQRQMKTSAAVSTQENGEAWDPQEHFSRFLEEAKRRHKRETEHEEAAASYSSPTPIQQAKVVGRSEEEEKKKKKINNNKNSRWKDNLFFWRKSEKKIKPKHELLTPTTTRESPHKNTSFRHVFSKATSGRRAVSGPIDAGGEQVCHLTRWNSYRATNTSRDAEIEISYTLLDQLNQPRKMDGAFGPIYLVT